MRRLDMFRECLLSCIGTLALVDRTIQLVTLPFDNIFLAAHCDWNKFGMLTPAVMAAGCGIFEHLFAIGTREGHGNSR